MGKTNSELERIFISYRYQVKNMLAIVSSIYKSVLMKGTCKRGFYSFKLE